MIELNRLKIFGNAASVKAIKKKFGEIKFEFGGNLTWESQEKHKFTLKRFRNMYKDLAKPLYILIPDEKILCVWPDDIRRYREIRYGTAGESTPALVFHLIEKVGLYICLKPTEEKLKIGDLGV